MLPAFDEGGARAVPSQSDGRHHHRAAHATKLAEYERLHGAALESGHHEPYAMATLEFGIAHERAALEWFEQLPPEIRGRGPWSEPAEATGDEAVRA